MGRSWVFALRVEELRWCWMVCRGRWMFLCMRRFGRGGVGLSVSVLAVGMVKGLGVGGSVCGFWVSGNLNVFDGEVKRKGCGGVGCHDRKFLVCLVEQKIYCDAFLVDDGPLVDILILVTCYEVKGADFWEICCMTYCASSCACRRRDSVNDCVCDMEISNPPGCAFCRCFSNDPGFDSYHIPSFLLRRVCFGCCEVKELGYQTQTRSPWLPGRLVNKARQFRYY